MMRGFKKSGLLLLAVMMVSALALAACGGKDDKKASDSAQTENTKKTDDTTKSDNKSSGTTGNSGESAKSDLKPYKLTLAYPGTAQKDEQKVEEEMNKYLTEKINATIDLMPVEWGAWNDKSNLMISTQQKIDIYFTAQWDRHAINVGKNAFLPLGDLLQKYGQDILKEIDPSILDGARVRGKLYGVPTMKEMAAEGGVVYRKDIADELGLDMSKVKTVEDLGPILQTVKEKKPDFTPLWLREGENFGAHYFSNIDYMGDDQTPGVIEKDGTDTVVKAASDFPRYVSLLKVARDYYQKGYINTDASTTTMSTNDAMKGGNVFMIVAPLKPGKAEEVAGYAGLSGKLEQITLNAKTTASSEAAGSMLAISTTSGDPERAMMFINMLHTDVYLNNLLNFGIENVHYKKVSDNVIEPTDQTPNYNPGAAWQFGSQFLNYLWKSEDPQKWDKFREFNKGAHLSPALGFLFDAKPVEAETAAVVNIRREFQKLLETGSVDIDKTLADYNAKLKTAGADKIIQEKQKQLDEMLAGKK